MTPAEQELEQHIRSQFGTVFVSEIVRMFGSRPYGWSDYATLYFLNELRRRGRWTFKYNNDANIDSKIVAANIVKEQNKFTVVAATTISQELINKFVESWKYALNIASALHPTTAANCSAFARTPPTVKSMSALAVFSAVIATSVRKSPPIPL